MKIALYGASGMVGSRVAAEALRRGHEVTGITRSGKPALKGVIAQTGDLADPEGVRDVAASHDVIVSATGPSRTGGSHSDWLHGIQNLIDNGSHGRVAAVGGAGSLVTDDQGTRLVDLPAFPEAHKPEALTHSAALEKFRSAPGSLDWTYLSPAPEIAPGERTGNYTLGGDSPAGERISAEDLAVALVDELERPRHSRRRFTAAN